jgi:hypothetical protein
VVGRAASVLGARRGLAFAALAVALGAYYATHQYWFTLTLWQDIAFLAFLVIPAVFGLVYCVLPFWSSPVAQLLATAGGFGVAAVLLQWAGAGPVSNFAKLGTMTFFAWAFLRFFEELSWVVLVACIVPFVDSYSVWRGPTSKLVKTQAFDILSFTFVVPGQSGGAKLGLPDLLFFALYLGAAARFGLRVGWTWVCLTASIGGTMALATWWNVGGLPALPLLSLGFLLPNADLLWRAVRHRNARGPRRAPT